MTVNTDLLFKVSEGILPEDQRRQFAMPLFNDHHVVKIFEATLSDDQKNALYARYLELGAAYREDGLMYVPLEVVKGWLPFARARIRAQMRRALLNGEPVYVHERVRRVRFDVSKFIALMREAGCRDFTFAALLVESQYRDGHMSKEEAINMLREYANKPALRLIMRSRVSCLEESSARMAAARIARMGYAERVSRGLYRLRGSYAKR